MPRPKVPVNVSYMENMLVVFLRTFERRRPQKDLVETLRKESIKNTREGFTNDDPYMSMTNESSYLKPIRID
jgi:hypothetical protein